MSTNKRYYWLKLQESFFDDDTIDFIESQESGEKYVLFYLKLCLKALKNEGKLIRYVGEMLLPYDDVGLAKLTRTDVDVVRSALALFTNIGLIKKLETGEIFLTQLNEMVGTETDKAKYMRQKRLKTAQIEKGEQCYPDVTPMLPECYTEIDIEKELDIDKDKDLDIDKDKHKRFQKQSDVNTGKSEKEPSPQTRILQAYDTCFKRLYSEGRVLTDKYMFDFGVVGKLIKGLLTQVSEEVIIQCIEKATEDEFYVSKGFPLTTILSKNCISSLMNAKGKTSRRFNDEISDEERLKGSDNDNLSY